MARWCSGTIGSHWLCEHQRICLILTLCGTTGVQLLVAVPCSPEDHNYLLCLVDIKRQDVVLDDFIHTWCCRLQPRFVDTRMGWAHNNRNAVCNYSQYKLELLFSPLNLFGHLLNNDRWSRSGKVEWQMLYLNCDSTNFTLFMFQIPQ